MMVEIQNNGSRIEADTKKTCKWKSYFYFQAAYF